MDQVTAERLAANEARFQEINSRLADDVAPFAGPDERIAFVCECSAPSCRDTIELALADYGAVRRRDGHYTIVRGHEIPEIERVVERHETHIVVQKRETALGAH
jgi:hypothetical protein